MTTGVPAARLSQNLFGVDSRWLSELAGTAMIDTSAEAAHSRTSSGWTAGRTTWRPAKRGSADLARSVASHSALTTEPSMTRAASGSRVDRLRRHLEPALPPELAEEQHDPAFGRQARGRADQVGPLGRAASSVADS